MRIIVDASRPKVDVDFCISAVLLRVLLALSGMEDDYYSLESILADNHVCLAISFDFGIGKADGPEIVVYVCTQCTGSGISRRRHRGRCTSLDPACTSRSRESG